MAHLPIPHPLGQGAPIDLQLGHRIGIIHRLKGDPVMSFLSPRLSIAFAPPVGFLSVWIRGRGLAAVLTIEGDPIEQQ